MFQFTVYAKKTRELLRNEERKLGVLRWVVRVLVEGDSWTPVMARYLGGVAARVRAFGGNPATISPSPYGGPEDGPRGCLPGCFVNCLSAILRILRFRQE